jgi:hypothetical protein
MNDACQRYAEDPEANSAHLRECAKCAAMYGADVQTHPLRVDSLPLAPWEGAAYRSWPLVIGAVLALLAVAFALCTAAGISLLTAIRSGMSTPLFRGYISTGAEALRTASLLWQIAFGLAFILVNTLLVLLLRRAPRGINA